MLVSRAEHVWPRPQSESDQNDVMDEQTLREIDDGSYTVLVGPSGDDGDLTLTDTFTVHG